jgi:hypothetical protein
MINENAENKKEVSENAIEKNLENLNYPATEDIFVRAEQEKAVDIESISNKKELENRPEIWDENTLPTQGIGSDLDVPGSELDDAQEQIGSEDEENNFYSQGDTK